MSRLIQISLVSVVALAACGGGGGGGSSDNGQDYPDSAYTETFTGQGRIAQDNGDDTFEPFGGNANLTFDTGPVQPNGGEPWRYRIGGTVTVGDGLDGSLNVLNGRAFIFLDDDAASLSPDFEPEYAGFGAWQGQEDGIIGVGYVSDRSPTNASNYPSSSATYFGESVGVVSNAAGPTASASDVTVQVSNGFSDVTVRSESTIVERTDLAEVFNAPELDFLATGQVGSGGYTATGDGMSVSGDFFGPNAETTVGVFSGQRDGLNYGGAYGADR